MNSPLGHPCFRNLCYKSPAQAGGSYDPLIDSMFFPSEDLPDDVFDIIYVFEQTHRIANINRFKCFMRRLTKDILKIIYLLCFEDKPTLNIIATRAKRAADSFSHDLKQLLLFKIESLYFSYNRTKVIDEIISLYLTIRSLREEKDSKLTKSSIDSIEKEALSPNAYQDFVPEHKINYANFYTKTKNILDNYPFDICTFLPWFIYNVNIAKSEEKHAGFRGFIDWHKKIETAKQPDFIPNVCFYCRIEVFLDDILPQFSKHGNSRFFSSITKRHGMYFWSKLDKTFKKSFYKCDKHCFLQKDEPNDLEKFDDNNSPLDSISTFFNRSISLFCQKTNNERQLTEPFVIFNYPITKINFDHLLTKVILSFILKAALASFYEGAFQCPFYSDMFCPNCKNKLKIYQTNEKIYNYFINNKMCNHWSSESFCIREL